MVEITKDFGRFAIWKLLYNNGRPWRQRAALLSSRSFFHERILLLILFYFFLTLFIWASLSVAECLRPEAITDNYRESHESLPRANTREERSASQSRISKCEFGREDMRCVNVSEIMFDVTFAYRFTVRYFTDGPRTLLQQTLCTKKKNRELVRPPAVVQL